MIKDVIAEDRRPENIILIKDDIKDFAKFSRIASSNAKEPPKETFLVRFRNATGAFGNFTNRNDSKIFHFVQFDYWDNVKPDNADRVNAIIYKNTLRDELDKYWGMKKKLFYLKRCYRFTNDPIYLEKHNRLAAAYDVIKNACLSYIHTLYWSDFSKLEVSDKTLNECKKIALHIFDQFVEIINRETDNEFDVEKEAMEILDVKI